MPISSLSVNESNDFDVSESPEACQESQKCNLFQWSDTVKFDNYSSFPKVKVYCFYIFICRNLKVTLKLQLLKKLVIIEVQMVGQL